MATQPMIVGVYQFASSGVHSLPIAVKYGDKMTSMGSLIGIVQASSGFENETLNIGNSIVNYGSKKWYCHPLLVMQVLSVIH